MIISNYQSDSIGNVVYLQKPCKRVVSIDFDYHHWQYKKTFFLSLPYTFFRLIYVAERNKFFYTEARFMSIGFGTSEDPNVLFRPPFPNVFANLNCCSPVDINRFSSVEDLIKAQINCFWSAEFSYTKENKYDAAGLYCPTYNSFVGLTSYVDQYEADALIVDHRKWEQKTKENPKWIPDENDMLRCYPDGDTFLYGLSVGAKMKYLSKNGQTERIR